MKIRFDNNRVDYAYTVPRPKITTIYAQWMDTATYWNAHALIRPECAYFYAVGKDVYSYSN